MGMNGSDYLALLLALQPPGPALPSSPDSIWGALLRAEADELARVDGRADGLMAESDPRTSAELLPDWERVCGLPGVCGASAQTVAARRAAVHAQLVELGGQRPADYVTLAATLGYPDARVEEFRPFRVGQSGAGDGLYDGDWRHCFRLRVQAGLVRRFTVGQSAAGEPLATWGDELLECVVSDRAPAHAIAQVAYGEEE
ncbi:Uncharacterized protein YmfQ in lambdoid prophage, DUF2313 family [Humidesulfovibrio mexicanus]|uniref:Uncharacterized protein YmfQ in lambdoid prophage, DUF2313 family n=2 Tax=Humidesulfovibrio mexicanus TaxID=147047 RepID=A0A239BCJ2_9BACT|nr:Uncharacterized protein YmfQ in lambdoid prophage, DUF2313 family [Humidesulfovibrio mexicanus]